jgi:hypothetical protein
LRKREKLISEHLQQFCIWGLHSCNLPKLWKWGIQQFCICVLQFGELGNWGRKLGINARPRAAWQTPIVRSSRATPARGGLFARGDKSWRSMTTCSPRQQDEGLCDRKVSMAGSPRWLPAASQIQVPGNSGDLEARELAARRENAAKKKRARPIARDQIRCGRKVAANTVVSTILVFIKSIMPNTWRWPFLPLVISFWDLANYNKW